MVLSSPLPTFRLSFEVVIPLLIKTEEWGFCLVGWFGSVPKGCCLTLAKFPSTLGFILVGTLGQAKVWIKCTLANSGSWRTSGPPSVLIPLSSEKSRECVCVIELLPRDFQRARCQV